MISLPINKKLFPGSLIAGSGTLTIDSDADQWADLFDRGLSFERNVDRVAEVAVEIGPSKSLRLGKKNVLALEISGGVEALHRIELLWPGDTDEAIERYGLGPFLKDGKLYVRLVLSGGVQGSLSGQYQGPLTASFGVEAGAHAALERFQLWEADTSAAKIVPALFHGVRLPQQIDAVGKIPAEGEVLIIRFGGYLGLNAALSWGYSVSGSKSFELNELALDLDYALKLVAAASVGYRLAGDFEILARRGQANNWVRYTVRKSRESQFDFAADLGFTAKVDLKGLPESADDFIAKVIGADGRRVLQALEKSRKFSSLDALEQEIDRIAKTTVAKLADKWIGAALDNTNVQRFFEVVGQVVKQYEEFDDRIIQLYEEFIDKQDELRQILDFLGQAADPEALRKQINKGGAVPQQAWELSQRLWGDAIYDLLLQQDEYQRFQNFVRDAQRFLDDTVTEKLRDFIETVKAELPIEGLFAKLKSISNPDELRNLADERLKALVEQVVGKAFEEIRGSEFADALQEIHETLDKLEEFKNKWYGKLTAAVERSFQFTLSYAYSRASRRDALLDVEVNLAHAKGPALARKAAKGDFAGLLAAYDSEAVQVREGRLTRGLQLSGQLQVNLFGWEYGRLSQLILNSDHAIEEHDGGLLHVYTTEVAIKQRRESGRRFKEIVASNFLLRTVATAFQPEGAPAAAIDPGTKRFLARALEHLSVNYDLTYEDQRTKPRELMQYLAFAQFLGLTPNAAELADQLQREFPEGMGSVKIDYVVRYEEDAVKSVFRLPTEAIQREARQAMRQFIAAKFMGMKETAWMRRIGFAYLGGDAPTVLSANRITVTLPAEITRNGTETLSIEGGQLESLKSLFRLERSYLERLGDFDRLVDRARDNRQAVPSDQLANASKNFLKTAAKLDKWRANAFFAVFDHLVAYANAGKGRRQTAMVMEITTPEKESITKILSPPAVEPAAAEAEPGAAAGALPPPETALAAVGGAG